jgi:4-hydroxy-tetrahydrodipicolinate synthase
MTLSKRPNHVGFKPIGLDYVRLKELMTMVNRREFLQTTAAAGIGLAAADLVHAAPSAATQTKSTQAKSAFFKGVYPAMVTPLTPEEKVDKQGMRNVVRYCLGGGVHGVLVLGTTGEFPAMTESMRQDAIEATLEEAQGKVPVLVGCGDNGTQKTVLQVRAAAQNKIDGVMVQVPWYFPLDQAAVIRHFQTVAEASTVPVILYHFPQMSKITYEPDTVAKLAAHPNIIGIKDSAGNITTMQQYIERTAEYDFVVANGWHTLALPAFELGAKATILDSCNLAPKLCVDLYTAWKRGDQATAMALHKKALLFWQMYSFGPGVAVIKFGLSKLGICGPIVTAPLTLNPGAEDKILPWLRKLGLNA